jgi:hypothetical protein
MVAQDAPGRNGVFHHDLEIVRKRIEKASGQTLPPVGNLDLRARLLKYSVVSQQDMSNRRVPFLVRFIERPSD